MKLVREIMTRNPRCIRRQTTLRDAAREMREHSLGCLPVTEGDTLVGVLTDRDIVLRCVADGRDPNQVRAGEAMSNKPRSIAGDRAIAEAASALKKRALRRLVAVDGDNKPVGVLSLSDLAACRDDRDTQVAAADVLRGVCSSR